MKLESALLIEILKDRYEYEQFRRNNFDNIIGIPVTILALLMSVLATFVFQEKQIHFSIKIGALFGMAPIAMAIFHLIRVFFGLKRKYDVLPTGDIIKDQYNRLSEFHETNETADSQELRHDKTILSFQEDLAQWYTKCNVVNCKINDLRAEHFHWAKLWLIISINDIFILLILQIILDL
jgi:hypothetical protein